MTESSESYLASSMAAAIASSQQPSSRSPLATRSARPCAQSKTACGLCCALVCWVYGCRQTQSGYGRSSAVAWLPASDDLVADCPEPLVFMGLDMAGTAHFAADVSYLAPPDHPPAEFIDRHTLDLSQTRKFIDLRAIMAEIDHHFACAGTRDTPSNCE